MANLNHVVLIGRLTRDAELKYISTGTAVAKASIAVNKRKKVNDQWVDEPNYFDVVIWGKTAENLNQYLQKGKEISVQGELHQNRWSHDGQNRSKIEIVAQDIQLLGGSGSGQKDRSQAHSTQSGGNFDNDLPVDDFEDYIPF